GELHETVPAAPRGPFPAGGVIRPERATSVQKGRRRHRAALAAEEQDMSLEELCRRAGIAASLVKDLEGFGLLSPTVVRGERRYRETDAEVAALCAQLAAYGISARHLRTF